MTMDRDAPDGIRPHRIRLRGPWRAEFVCHEGDAEPVKQDLGRYQAPDGLAAVLPANLPGRLTLRRSFHRPTGLTDGTRVLLDIESTHPGTWTLNGVASGTLTRGMTSAAIESELAPHNELCIDLEIDGDDSMRQPICDVRLAIYGEKE